MNVQKHYRTLVLVVGLVFFASAFFGGQDLPFSGLFQPVAVVVTVSIWVGMWWRERQLAGPLRRIAEANGWTFEPSAPGLARSWRIAPFGGSVKSEASSVIRGTVGARGFVAFNYDVRSGDDKNDAIEYYSVVALDLPVHLPLLEVRATLGGVEQALGVDRIEIEHEGFNRRYRVGCADRRLASDLLTPRTVEALIAGRIVNLRIGAGRAFAWAPGRLEVDEVLGWSRSLLTAVDLIPEFVWKDHSPQQAGPGLTWSAGASSLGQMPSPSQEPS